MFRWPFCRAEHRQAGPSLSRSTIVIEPLEMRRFLSAGPVPRPDHVVIVVEENKSFASLFGKSVASIPGMAAPIQFRSEKAPYLKSLAQMGALFTNSSGITHPSEPNYLALFSGSTQGVHSDATPKHPLSGPDLGGELIGAGQSFTGFSEGLPSVGFTGDKHGGYARKHNPWVDFTDVPASANQPFTAFPADLSQLPTVSFVVPNQSNDMHSGSVQKADQWLKKNIDGYVQWAQSHNSLLIITWDEGSGGNHIPTLMVGPMVKPGNYSEPINHYNVLRTVEDMYGLQPSNAAAKAAPITDVWR